MIFLLQDTDSPHASEPSECRVSACILPILAHGYPREMENNLAMDYYRKTGIVLPVVAVLLSVTVMLRAQDGVPEMPEDTLSEVVVTADRIREIVPAQKLAGQQLERLRTNSVADALRYFSGVQVEAYGGIG